MLILEKEFRAKLYDHEFEFSDATAFSLLTIIIILLILIVVGFVLWRCCRKNAKFYRSRIAYHHRQLERSKTIVDNRSAVQQQSHMYTPISALSTAAFASKCACFCIFIK